MENESLRLRMFYGTPLFVEPPQRHIIVRVPLEQFPESEILSIDDKGLRRKLRKINRMIRKGEL